MREELTLDCVSVLGEGGKRRRRRARARQAAAVGEAGMEELDSYQRKHPSSIGSTKRVGTARQSSRTSFQGRGRPETVGGGGEVHSGTVGHEEDRDAGSISWRFSSIPWGRG